MTMRGLWTLGRALVGAVPPRSCVGATRRRRDKWDNPGERTSLEPLPFCKNPHPGRIRCRSPNPLHAGKCESRWSTTTGTLTTTRGNIEVLSGAPRTQMDGL